GGRRTGMAKIGWGMMLGAVGGILAIVGAILPWVTISITTGTIAYPGCTGNTCTFSGIQSGYGGILVLVFALIGLIMVVIPGKPVMGLLAFVFGLLALIFALLGYIGLSLIGSLAGLTGQITVTVGSGVCLAFIG